MKITFEIDSESLQKALATEAADKPTSSKSADEVPAKAESPAPTKQRATKQSEPDKTSTPRASEEKQSKKSEEPSPRPHAASSSSGNFGGIPDIADPDRGKRGYHYVYQEENR